MKMQFLIAAVLSLLCSLAQAQVPPTPVKLNPGNLEHRGHLLEFCTEALMYFDIAVDPAALTSCLAVPNVLLQVREKSPQIRYDIEGFMTINKKLFACQGNVRANRRVVLKNCLQMGLF